MKKIRILAAAAAGTLLMQSAAVLPVSAADDSIFSDGFESGTCGWEGRGSASVAVTSANAYAGSGALSVTGRNDAWNGAQKDISTVCSAGETYSFSVCVRFESGTKPVKFMLSLAYKNSANETEYGHLADAETIGGFYVQLANDSYTIPAGASAPILYVETETGSTSFTIDEAICAPKGTKIDGPKPVKFTLGDVDFDGAVSAADFTLAKRYMGKDFPNKNMLRAADVDQSGKVDANDIGWYQKYLLTQETSYPEPVKPEYVSEPFDYNPALQYHPFDEKEYLSKSSHPGQVILEHYEGPKGTNSLYVYLPPDYDENQKYNIFYLMHGGGENEKTLFHQDDTMMQNIFDHMIANGDMEPLIVVTPTWNQVGSENFWQELRERVVPFVEGKYSTYAESTELEDLQASRYHRAYGGFSMGSVSTWGVFMHDLDMFAYFMPLSGEYKVNGLSISTQAQMIIDAIDKSGLQPDEYFIIGATGSNDMAQPTMTQLMNELKKYDKQLIYTSDLSQGNFYYMMANGKEHWWGHVRHYVYDVLPYFFHEKQ